MLYISESIWPCCRFTCHKQRIVHQLFIQQFGTSHYNFCTEKLPNRGKKRLEIFQSLGPHMVFLLNNNVGNIYSRCLMFDASSSIKLLKNLPQKNPPFLCSETCWGPDIGHSSHKRDGWHNRQRPRDHQPFQSLRWLDFCHVAVNSQVCSLGTKVYQCWFGSVFVSAVSTWLVFVFQMLGIPPSTQKKNSTLPHCNKAPAPPFPPRLPSIIRSEGRCFSSRKLGLWSRVKATPSHALPFFVPSTAVLSWVKTVALEVSACQKKNGKVFQTHYVQIAGKKKWMVEELNVWHPI